MRGKAPLHEDFELLTWITPAYAGKRAYLLTTCSIFEDHPRVCGEKADEMCDQFIKEGSPPRMRGKAYRCRKLTRNTGITPAYAGKRVYPRFLPLIPWDHPRVCGEKLLFILTEFYNQGSPPRMRGKVACVFF